MWEATDECVAFITEFLANIHEGRLDSFAVPVAPDDQSPPSGFGELLTPAIELFTKWPWMLAEASIDTIAIARQSIYFGGKAQFGDGKPIILVPQLGSTLPFILLSNWLRVLGYRPVTTRVSVNFDDQSIANLIRVTTQRIGRKAVLVAPASAMQLASASADVHKDWVSDVVVLNASHRLDMPLGVRAHFISFGWSLPFAVAALPLVLRNIRIELIEAPGSVALPSSASSSSRLPHAEHQLSAEGDQK
jgi:hypothetical protein